MPTFSIRAAASCMLLGCLLAGCSKKEAPQATQPAEPASQTAQSAPTVPAPAPVPAAAPASSAQGASPVQSPTPPPPSSPPASAGKSGPSTQGEFPGVTMTVQELKRTGNTVTLRLAVANESNNEFAFGYYFGEHDFGSIGSIHLIDSTNKKEYFVVQNSNGNCVCSVNIANIPPGSGSVVWAKFPAPPDDVQKVTVEIPHFMPLEDVPISK